ncbi:hypothetical protein SGL43_06618 [Streptomyces globisporus]|uniref:Uncharacterized protein n=1 Tax=Streptomyces globisporus TaxID=1908 RepID=A0ABN8VER0_STRGL|nr:hypothetical protein [Streptomyces globisporus]CAH9419563.1 hypothetical protein SGL43_06618 [Streptomyces globisporus]
MTDTSPTPADRPADQLRAAAYRASTPAGLATLLTRLADASDHHATGEGGVVATLVHPALAVARQLLGTTVTEGAATEETDEERTDRLHVERAHVEGEHALCGVTCEATFPSVMLRNGILARAVPGSAVMLDELLRRAAAPPAPADRATVLREAADFVGNDDDCDCGGCDSCIPNKLADGLRAMAGEAAAGVQPPTTADPLADCATEYRVPVPENGGTELRLRRGHAPYASGWSVAVPGYGGGRALTELGWSDSIGALSADRLFCWPDAATAVDAARRALPAAPAAPEERS